ncbi:hypothetical protein J4P41_12070 [Gluconobacter sp. NFX36]|uniref:hypothetical protein n=1 Tax=Gluconobacter TaxID=441 RepID=UPI003CF5F05C
MAHTLLAVGPVIRGRLLIFGFLMAQRLTEGVGNGITDKLSPLSRALAALRI